MLPMPGQESSPCFLAAARLSRCIMAEHRGRRIDPWSGESGHICQRSSSATACPVGRQTMVGVLVNKSWRHGPLLLHRAQAPAAFPRLLRPDPSGGCQQRRHNDGSGITRDKPTVDRAPTLPPPLNSPDRTLSGAGLGADGCGCGCGSSDLGSFRNENSVELAAAAIFVKSIARLRPALRPSCQARRTDRNRSGWK